MRTCTPKPSLIRDRRMGGVRRFFPDWSRGVPAKEGRSAEMWRFREDGFAWGRFTKNLLFLTTRSGRTPSRSNRLRSRRRAPTSRCQKQKILREAPPSETVLPESPHLRRAALLRRNSPAPVRKKPAHSTHASVAYK